YIRAFKNNAGIGLGRMQREIDAFAAMSPKSRTGNRTREGFLYGRKERNGHRGEITRHVEQNALRNHRVFSGGDPIHIAVYKVAIITGWYGMLQRISFGNQPVVAGVNHPAMARDHKENGREIISSIAVSGTPGYPASLLPAKGVGDRKDRSPTG